MPTFVIANPTPGVGKTATTVNLASALSAVGGRVLVIDCDPRGGATAALQKYTTTVGLYGVLSGGLPLSVAVAATSSPRVDMLQSSYRLAYLDDLSRPDIWFRETLTGLDRIYDHVLIDCPPSLGTLSINALGMADWVLVPVSCRVEHQSRGLHDLDNALGRVAGSAGGPSKIFGAIVTQHRPADIRSQRVVDMVRERYPDRVLAAVIPDDPRVHEAMTDGRSVLDFDALAPAAEAYGSLGREVSAWLAAALTK